MDIPVSLRRWFVAHFVVDALFAIPLLLAPALFLGSLGWTCVDSATARLVGAALLAIGCTSLRERNAGADVFRSLLNLKIIWSLGAGFGLLAAIGGGAPQAAWAFLSAFVAFAGVWIHYRIRMKQMGRAEQLDAQP